MGVETFVPMRKIVFGEENRKKWGGESAPNFITTVTSDGNTPYDIYCMSNRAMETCPRCHLNTVCKSKVADLDPETAKLILKNPPSA